MKKILVILIMLLAVSAFGETKSELLATIATKFDVVGTPVLKEDVSAGFDVKMYQVKTFKLQGTNAGVSRSFKFYVLDEGGAGEIAYFHHSEPQPTVNAFFGAIETYLKSNNIILKRIGNVNLVEKWAEVEAWEWTGAVFIFKTYLVQKPDTVLIHSEIQ